MEAVAWLVLLAVPAFTSWPRAVYAAYSLLWVGPAVRRLRREGGLA